MKHTIKDNTTRREVATAANEYGSNAPKMPRDIKASGVLGPRGNSAVNDLKPLVATPPRAELPHSGLRRTLTDSMPTETTRNDSMHAQEVHSESGSVAVNASRRSVCPANASKPTLNDSNGTILHAEISSPITDNASAPTPGSSTCLDVCGQQEVSRPAHPHVSQDVRKASDELEDTTAHCIPMCLTQSALHSLPIRAPGMILSVKCRTKFSSNVERKL